MMTLKNKMDQINDLLDRYVLPWPVRYLTFRFVILLTIGLLIPLLVFANNTVLVLGINSYLNTMGVAVSSIVLLYATLGEVRQKQIAELQEKRAQEDHDHLTAMHTLIMQTLQNQNIEIAELKQIVTTLGGKAPGEKEELSVPDMKALHPRGEDRFGEDDLRRRWEVTLHHNALATTIRNDLIGLEDDE
jgi:uncharacterized membrane protein